MHKLFTIAIVAAMLFSSLALLPAPARATETIPNEQIGELTVFHQNYSVIGIPNNVFLANHVGTDINNATLTYDNENKAIKFHAWTGNTMKLWIGGLYPAIRTTYKIRMNIQSDNVWSYIDINIAHTEIILFNKLSTYLMKYYYYNETSGADEYTSISFSTPDMQPPTLVLEYNGMNKTYHLTLKENSTIDIWANLLSGAYLLNYPVLTPPSILIHNIIDSAATYADIYLYSLEQTIPRYTITAIPRNDLQAFAFDIRSLDSNYKSIEYMKNYGFRATLDLEPERGWESNESEKSYYRDLVENYSWETGLHLNVAPNSLSLTAAKENITSQYNYIIENFGHTPKTWCSQGNQANTTHANYAYEQHGLIWRSSVEGIRAYSNIGNIDNETWHFWDIASQHFFINPTFTHTTDKDPANESYSLDYSKFITWLDRLHEHNIKVVPFIEYFEINKNQIDFYATNIQRGDGYFKFTAHTNGYKAYVDVAYTPTANTVVKDLTTGKIVSWEKGSVQFWVEDGHTYEIIDTMKQAINISIDWTYAIVNAMIPIAIFAVLLSALTQILQAVRKSVRFRK